MNDVDWNREMNNSKRLIRLNNYRAGTSIDHNWRSMLSNGNFMTRNKGMAVCEQSNLHNLRHFCSLHVISNVVNPNASTYSVRQTLRPNANATVPPKLFEFQLKISLFTFRLNFQFVCNNLMKSCACVDEIHRGKHGIVWRRSSSIFMTVENFEGERERRKKRFERE